ncbi:MAG TPA: Omp28-related outer membrane protein [Saprospiraceae bacterium]|nr:Omp28-related outer membrane protein [Saprospiraceae bacterium]
MKNLIPLILITLCFLSCTKYEDDSPVDLTPGIWFIKVKSSSYAIPFNGLGAAELFAYSSSGDNITASTTFFVNHEKLDGNKFVPGALGIYSITASYYDLNSEPIEIKVEPPLNKKVLIENFTSRICGFCPWIAARLDSLDQASPNVISYSIHGQDELEVEETPVLQELLVVYHRPAIRINRGYARNFSAPIQIKPLIDSVQYFLATQPQLELSIQSSVQGQSVTAKVSGKYYEDINVKDVIFLTLALVEDGVITQDQYNYFNGYPWDYCPFATQPFYMPDYKNHNVLRKVLTDPKGDLITTVPFEYGIVQELGSFTFSIDSTFDIGNLKLIAFVHRQQDGIEASTVLNSQMVKVGNQVAFNE